MAYTPPNLPNFMNAQYENFSPFKNILEGYKASYLPEEMQNKMQQDKLQQALTQAQAAHYQQQSNSPFSEFGKSLEDYSKIPQEDPRKALFERYLQDKAMANQRQGQTQETEKERAIRAMLDPNITEEQKNYLSQAYGIQRPQNTENISNYPKGVQTQLIKENRQYLDQAKSAKKSIKNLDRLEEITKKHPKLANYFSAALESGEDIPTIKEQVLKKFAGSEAELTALQTYNKIVSEFVLEMSKSIGGTRSTDNLRNAIARSKPSSRNTYEANMNIYKHLKEELTPLAADEENILKSIKENKRYYPSMSGTSNEAKSQEDVFNKHLSEGQNLDERLKEYGITRQQLEYNMRKHSKSAEEVFEALASQRRK